MEPTLSVAPSQRAGRHMLTVEGEIDLATISILERHIQEAVASGASELLLDMSAVSFIDSSGLRALIAARDSLDGPLAIVAPSRAVRRLLDVVELASTIQVLDSAEDADRE
jgi:anti-anti-sigma factor